MKTAIIFINGDRTDVSQVVKYIDRQTLIIGVDGGVKHALGLGLKPHVVIGDMDSRGWPRGRVPRGVEAAKGAPNPDGRELRTGPDNIKYLIYPSDKDFTDSELAIKYATEQGYRKIILAGSLGTRVDHFLGNVLLFLRKDYQKIDLRMIEGNQEIYLIRKKAIIKGKKGDTVSFIPLEGEARGVTFEGFEYDEKRGYKNCTLSIQGNRGLSNMLTQKRGIVTIKQGVLLTVHTRI